MSRLSLACSTLLIVISGSFVISNDTKAQQYASLSQTSSVTHFSVEIGDRTIAAACAGDGGPTVFQEIGGPDPEGGVVGIDEAGMFISGILGTRFCGYDRAGTGQSDAGPNGIRTLSEAGEDLLAVLAAPETACPCVVMAESLGGAIALAALTLDPTNFAGFVSLDSLTPGYAEDVLALAPEGSPESDLEPFFAGENEEAISYIMTDEMVPSSPPAMPLRVLTHGAGDPPPCPCSEGFPVDDLESAWQANQVQLADLLGVDVIVAENTGHIIAGENAQLVLEMIFEVFAEIEAIATPAA